MAHKPPKPTADVGQLLSMFRAGLRMGTLHINAFSGDGTPERLRYLLSSSIMRSSVARTTTWRQ